MIVDPRARPGSACRHLFGPVPSRRLGLSLGVDLVPLKTCSFNCVFCQVGRSARTILDRREYVPVDEVLAEFGTWLAEGGTADTLTLSGSGEPTLHSRFGEVLEGLGQKSDIRRALLTNSSLLHIPQVRSSAALADIVKVSLSAWDDASFEAVNRPHPDLRFGTVVDSLRSFRGEFSGELWLEVFVLSGVNSSEEAMTKIADLASRFTPDRIHLNTVVRPPAEDSATPVAMSLLAEFTRLFTPCAEVIAGHRIDSTERCGPSGERIVAMLRRRPCTVADVTDAFGLCPGEAARYLSELVARGEIREDRREDSVYYC